MKVHVCDIGKNSAEILADSLSKFVVGINGRENVEGVFLSPYGAENEVSGFVVGVVYEGDMIQNVVDADRIELVKASYATGYNLNVRPVSMAWYRYECIQGDTAAFPAKAMLKTGSVFYDKNGTLARLKKELCKNDEVVGCSDVVVCPAIQYKKEM